MEATAMSVSRPDPMPECMPTYNPGSLLTYQLEAVRAQFGPEDELPISDGASTDGSLDIARRAAEQGPRIVVSRSASNIGPPRTRNHGTPIARRQKLAFCDSDDICAPNWLNKLSEALQTHPLVGCHLDIMALNSPWARRALPESPTENGLPAWHGGFHYTISASIGAKRDLATEIGGFDGELSCSEDVDSSIRVAKIGQSAHFTLDPVAYYRLRPTIPSLFRQQQNYGNGVFRLIKKLSDGEPELLDSDPLSATYHARDLHPKQLTRALARRYGHVDARASNNRSRSSCKVM